jgi:iron complex outermembrane receptor protein
MDQTNYQGKILLRELSGFIEQAQLDVSKTDYQHRELEIEDGMSHLGTRFDVQSQEARLELSHRPLANLNGTIGVHYSDRDLEALGEEAFVPPSQTRNNGIFVIEDVSIGSGSAELGMRYDQQSVNSKGIGSIDHNSLNLSASWIQPVTETQTVGLVLSRTERPPSAEELLANGEHVATQTYEVGALDLDTESAWNIEFNWRYSGDFDSNISLYHRVFSDFIYAQDTGTRLSHDLLDDGAAGILACSSDLADFDNDPDHFAQALPCYAQSQEDARFSGIEAEITAPVGEQHNFRLWGDLVRARLDTGGDVPRIPPARIGASWHFSSGLWQLELSALHAFDQNRAGDNEADTDGYLRIDAYLSYGTGQWRLFIKGNNLTDREIRNATSYLREIAPQPGRSVVLGARLSF